MSYLADRISGVLAIDDSHPAIYFKDEVFSWGYVRGVAEALRDKLGELGLGEAAAVGCLLRTRPPHFAAILGVLIGERCVTTLNPIMPDERLADDIRSLRPPVVVGAADDWARTAVRDAVAEVGAAGLLLTGDPANPVAAVPGLEKIGPGPHLEPQPGVAVLMLTSGTTGKPKRAPLGYRQLELNIKRAARADKDWTEDAPPKLNNEIRIMFSPFVHISGMYFVISCTIGGSGARLIERFSVEEWRKAIVELRPKSAGGPPTVLKMILDANLPKEDLASLTNMTAGTAPTPPEVIDEFIRRYDLPVLTTYGATEFAGAVCGWSLAAFRKYWPEKRGSAGRIYPGIDARTVDPATGEPLPAGEPGLLELRSEAVGNNGDWVRTSDLARIDPEHFLWILGRADNAIIRGGFKVAPDTVVKALEKHPAIDEASVVGMPDERLGAVPVAAYVVKRGAEAPSAAELAGFLRERVNPYEIPVAFRQVEELPRTPSLKVSMPGVRALFEADVGLRLQPLRDDRWTPPTRSPTPPRRPPSGPRSALGWPLTAPNTRNLRRLPGAKPSWSPGPTPGRRPSSPPATRPGRAQGRRRRCPPPSAGDHLQRGGRPLSHPALHRPAPGSQDGHVGGGPARHGRPTRAVHEAHGGGRGRLVPAVLRALRRLGPGRGAHPGGARRRQLDRQRPEGVVEPGPLGRLRPAAGAHQSVGPQAQGPQLLRDRHDDAGGRGAADPADHRQSRTSTRPSSPTWWSRRQPDRGRGRGLGRGHDRALHRTQPVGRRRAGSGGVRDLIELAGRTRRAGGTALDSAAVRAKLAQWWVEEQGLRQLRQAGAER